jgi:hypothetical protein
VIGLSGEKHFQNYHRVLNHAVWSSLEASHILLGLLISTFASRDLKSQWLALAELDVADTHSVGKTSLGVTVSDCPKYLQRDFLLFQPKRD